MATLTADRTRRSGSGGPLGPMLGNLAALGAGLLVMLLLCEIALRVIDLPFGSSVICRARKPQ